MDKLLIKAALRGTAYAADFSVADTNTGAIKEMLIEAGIDPENYSARDLITKKPVIFAIIAEAIDEILPESVTDIMGAFAEVKTYARDEQAVFTLKVGKRRAHLSIKRGARAGIYRAAQWDNKLMELVTETWVVGDYVSLEDILLGRVSLSEYYQNLVVGFQHRIYEETVAALRSASSLAPASHMITDDGTALESNLDKLVRIAAAYGPNPVIFGFRSELSKLKNLTNWVVDADKEDIRAYGMIKELHGIPVVELPNYILSDGAAIDWAFREDQIFVLPSDAKPVKIAMRGESVIVEDVMPAGQQMWNCHKMMGIGLLLADNVCILTDSSNNEQGEY